MNLSHIPYGHRSSAADLLVSKANRLTELDSIGSIQGISAKQRKAIRKGVDFYEMALCLMKAFDPNYCTIANWRCLALIKLGRFSEAVTQYEEIVRISEKTEGKHSPNATAQLAKDQIEKYSAYEDIPSGDSEDADTDTFDDPPYCMFASEFCSLLADQNFKKAHSLLSESAKKIWSPKELKSAWVSMVESDDVPDCNLLENMTEWPSRKEKEIGWCYYSVSTNLVNEAVSVVVATTEYNTYQVSEIEFGRP